MTRTIVDIDVAEYRRAGFVAPLPVLSAEEVDRAQQLYDRLQSLVPAGQSTMAIDWWHQLDRELYELCTHPRILDYAEQIIGPDFYLWGSQFFAKEPGADSTVPWHQDAYYWPIEPHRAVTVWLAVNDSFPENGAMKVIPGSHKKKMTHKPTARSSDVLDVQVDAPDLCADDAVHLTLQAGECSLHDDNIVHGSDGNASSVRRCGLTIRFSAGESKCDTSVWPFFKAYWARGEDRWNHNPIGKPPESLLTEYRSVTPRTGQR